MVSATAATMESGETIAINNATATAQAGAAIVLRETAIPVQTQTSGEPPAITIVQADAPMVAIKTLANATVVLAPTNGVPSVKTHAAVDATAAATKPMAAVMIATQEPLEPHATKTAPPIATHFFAKEMTDYAHTAA